MKTLVISGGSSGIGKATASLFAERGWCVFELSRHGAEESKVERRKTAALKDVGEVMHVTCDVCSEESCRKAIAEVRAENIQPFPIREHKHAVRILFVPEFEVFIAAEKSVTYFFVKCFQTFGKFKTHSLFGIGDFGNIYRVEFRICGFKLFYVFKQK